MGPLKNASLTKNTRLVHGALCLSVHAKRSCDKAKIFQLLLTLERERRSMTAEAHAQRFLLSEMECRCERPRRRAYTMLRLCEMYRVAPGADVPLPQIRNYVPVATAVNRPPVHGTVATDKREAAGTEAKPLPCTALSRKAVHIFRRDSLTHYSHNCFRSLHSTLTH